MHAYTLIERSSPIIAATISGDIPRRRRTKIESVVIAAAAVRASDTTLMGLFGVGPVIAAAILGDVPDISRVPHPRPVGRLQRRRTGRASSGKRTVFGCPGAGTGG